MLRLAAAYDAGDEHVQPPRHRGRPSTGAASAPRCSPPRRSSASAATATSRPAPMARLFRESPLNGIWEGSGNVICLDVLRAVAREPDSLDALLAEIETARGADARLRPLRRRPRRRAGRPRRGRPAAQGRGASPSGWPSPCRRRCCCAIRQPAVADAFCASRLAGERRADVRRPPRRRRRDRHRRARLAVNRSPACATTNGESGLENRAA